MTWKMRYHVASYLRSSLWIIPVAAVMHDGTSGIVLAVDLPQLVAAAEKADGVVEFAPQVGDFVGVDKPLFLLHGGAATIDDESLRGCVIFGSGRTLEQDPLFGFRILVDIAIFSTGCSRRIISFPQILPSRAFPTRKVSADRPGRNSRNRPMERTPSFPC